MEVSASARSRFLIDSLLSLRPPGALLSRVDPPELSPAGSSGCSAPPSPNKVAVSRLESALGPGQLQQLQPRNVSSSFLIRNILADCRPCCDPGQVCPEPGQPEPFQSAPEEDYQDKSPSSSSSDESRGKTSNNKYNILS